MGGWIIAGGAPDGVGSICCGGTPCGGAPGGPIEVGCCGAPEAAGYMGEAGGGCEWVMGKDARGC